MQISKILGALVFALFVSACATATPAASKAPGSAMQSGVPGNFLANDVRQVLAGDVEALIGAFVWDATPQGNEFWGRQHAARSLSPEARQALLGFLDAYNRAVRVPRDGIPEGFDVTAARSILDGDTHAVRDAFVWEHTPQGPDFWLRVQDAQQLAPEAAAAIRDWIARFEAGERGPPLPQF